jgi:LacI family transcriptional regulator
MRDVARVAGVSASTVSHVLNETRFVKPQTRDTVLAAIRETGYSPNTIARSLARASTGLIGLAISVPTNPYFAELVHAIETQAGRHGYMLLLGDTRDDPVHERKIVRALRERRVDGLLLAASADPVETLDYLGAQRLPVVLIDRLPSLAFDWVGTENTESTARLVQHLGELGHARIGMVSGLAGLSTSAERLDGYLLGLARLGLPFDRRLVVPGRSRTEPASLAVRRLMGLPKPPTALVVANNLMTIGAVKELRRLGLRVPADIALVSFDDFQWAELFAPRLTTIAQPIRDFGVEAIRLLLHRLAEPERDPVAVRLQPAFMHRESCGCPYQPDGPPTASRQP